MSDSRKHDRDARRRDEDFVQGVLGKTSGSPCERAAGMLPDLTDDVLGEMDRHLVRAHLENCPGCRALAVTMGWLEPMLPKMAILDPGPEFTQRVLASTSLAAPGIAAGPVTEPGGFGPAGWMDRLGRWWGQQILRPVFPLQVAYAATVLLILLTATPISPFREAPGRMLATMQAGPGTLPILGPVLDAATEGASDWIETRSDQASSAVRNRVTGSWQNVDNGFRSRLERSASERSQMKAALDSAGRHLRDSDLSNLGYDLHQFMKSTRQAWSRWWQEDSIEEQEPIESERSTP